ncbi:hypothetical protein Y032_0005g2764 [Ancylostoma ceylanicum]|uniref:Uncharacterized protein n=1 Tax=Ancylostoma ceylanicum TaxID=53326 RepID=A0A016VST8_9BILA|nr:hypothetical protein Y032_0005g2764 [Ancylostoma ceylanicum]
MLASENRVDGGVRYAPRPVARAALNFSQMRRSVEIVFRMRRGLRNQLILLRLLVPDSELEIAWEALPAVR